MTKALDANFIAQKNTYIQTDAGPFLFLLELDRDGTNKVYYAKGHRNVTFNSQVYSANSFAVGLPESDSSGSTKNFMVSIQNVDQVMITYLENDEIINRPMVIREVHADFLDTVASKIVFRGNVINADADAYNVTLTCGALDMRGFIVPQGTYSRTRCRWLYKGDECGSVSGLSTCPKDIAACETRGVLERFGAFPGMAIVNP